MNAQGDGQESGGIVLVYVFLCIRDVGLGWASTSVDSIEYFFDYFFGFINVVTSFLRGQRLEDFDPAKIVSWAWGLTKFA